MGALANSPDYLGNSTDADWLKLRCAIFGKLVFKIKNWGLKKNLWTDFPGLVGLQGKLMVQSGKALVFARCLQVKYAYFVQ